MTKEEQLSNLKSHVEFLQLRAERITAAINAKKAQRSRILIRLGEVFGEIEKLDKEAKDDSK